MLTQPQVLPQISIKGYRELLKRLRQQSNDDASTSSALFQQAKELALAQLQRNKGTGRIDPKRAFNRLRQQIVDTKQGFKRLKDTKKEKLKATYTALKQQRLAKTAKGQNSILGTEGLSRTLVLGTVGVLSKGFMTLLSSLEVEGSEILQRALKRPEPQALITVSNHAAALDDPLLLAAIMPLRSLSTPADFRWSLCATDRCFKNDFMASFFRAGKTLPVERGGGMQQPGIQGAEARLQAGDWVHIFPEGTRSRDGRMGPIRRGIGHLVTACSTPPLVIPFVHSGMDKLLPPGSSLPRLGQNVRVLIGDPISFSDIHTRSQVEQWSSERLVKAITQRVAEALYDLKAQLEGLPVSAVTREVSSATVDSQALMPLIEEQLDGLRHSWQQSALHKGCQQWQALQHLPPAWLQPAQQIHSLRGILQVAQESGSASLMALRNHFGEGTALMRGLVSVAV